MQVRHLQLQLKNFKDEQSHVQEILHRVKTTAKPVETQDPALPRWSDQNNSLKSPVSSPNNSAEKGSSKHLSATSTACEAARMFLCPFNYVIFVEVISKYELNPLCDVSMLSAYSLLLCAPHSCGC